MDSALKSTMKHFLILNFRPETSLEEMMEALADLPLMNQPGSAYRYSIGPDVALDW